MCLGCEEHPGEDVVVETVQYGCDCLAEVLEDGVRKDGAVRVAEEVSVFGHAEALQDLRCRWDGIDEVAEPLEGEDCGDISDMYVSLMSQHTRALSRTRDL